MNSLNFLPVKDILTGREVKMNWEAMALLLPPLSADLLTKVEAKGGQAPKASWRKTWTSLWRRKLTAVSQLSN